MPNAALIPRRATKIEPLVAVVDGYPETRHTLRVETGEAPLEDGTVVQDHAVARSERLTLTGWVSDLSSADGTRRARDAWTAIRRLHREVETLEVITAFGSYPEMLITEASSEEVGGGMQFTLKLSEVIRVGRERHAVSGDATGPAVGRQSTSERGLVSASPETLQGPAPEIEIQEIENASGGGSGAFASLSAQAPGLTDDPRAAAQFSAALAEAESSQTSAFGGAAFARLSAALDTAQEVSAPARSALGRVQRELAARNALLGGAAHRLAGIPGTGALVSRLRSLSHRVSSAQSQIAGARSRADRVGLGG